MKTEQDFTIKDDTGILEGVTLSAEVDAVKEFAINNKDVKYLLVISNDKRYFKLENNRLVSSEGRFDNPFYVEPEIIEPTPTINTCDCNERLDDLERRIKEIEDKLL